MPVVTEELVPSLCLILINQNCHLNRHICLVATVGTDLTAVAAEYGTRHRAESGEE